MGDKKIVEDTIVEQKEKAKSKLLKIDVDEIGGSSEVYQVFVSPDGDIYDVMFHLTDMNYNVFGHNMFHSLQLVVLTEVSLLFFLIKKFLEQLFVSPPL